MKPRPVAFLQIDLDPVWAARRAYGRDASPPGPDGADPVWLEAVPRFLELLGEIEAPATFFVVGADAASRSHRARLAEILNAGHEVANHSHAHRLDLARLPRPEIAADIARAQTVLAESCGEAPRGFRCPGYGLSENLLDELRAQDFAYDASLLPTPWALAMRAVARLAVAPRDRRRPGRMARDRKSVV